MVLAADCCQIRVVAAFNVILNQLFPKPSLESVSSPKFLTRQFFAYSNKTKEQTL